MKIEVSKEQAKLSKEQKKFNDLIAKLELLKNKQIDVEDTVRKRIEKYRKEVLIHIFEEQELILKLIKKINYIAYQPKLFTKSELFTLEDFMEEFIGEYLDDVGKDKELEEIFNRLRVHSYKETIEHTNTAMRSMFGAEFKKRFGLDIEEGDLSDFNFTDFSEENMQKFQEAFIHQQEKKREKNIFEEDIKEKPKSKKQQKEEELKRQKEEIKNKSLKSIFINLSKILHPDLEQELDAKSKKEEAMKQAVVAYESKDLQALLQLELEWIFKDTSHIATMAKEKLDVYISQFTDKIKEIEHNIHRLLDYNEYSPIRHLHNLSNQNFNSRIKGMSELQKKKNEENTSLLEMDVTKANKKDFIKRLPVVEDDGFSIEDLFYMMHM